ncbi:hypothetical protein [Alicyclobacillus fodiniaquatilis]|jgi:hypothetical protein|uniref:Uncharacterized protein n=1 Tax=Alicyclobacillus fodiniaquatilis TaxID=1661150 RepID=A0ABW4JHC9_9BACL
MQTQEWIDLYHGSESVDAQLLYDADTKLRRANRAERYFPSNGKRLSKYYAPPRKTAQEVD